MSQPRGTALLVDDDDAIRESAREILKMEGYAVLEAANGREALALLDAGVALPCVVLLDMMMPVMSGHQFLDALHRRPHLSALVPVVVWTAGRDESFGPPKPRHVLRKPFDIAHLLAVVEAACTAAA